MEACKFSGGIEKANLILSAGILQKSWHCISGLQPSHHPTFSVQELPKATIMAFSAVESQLGQDSPEPTLQRLDENDPTFGFLASKKFPSFSIRSSPLSAFLSLLESTDLDLEKKLKELTAKGKPQLILVGESLGGSIAALCTLRLLKDNLPLVPICVTFGSPLLGDVGLEKAISNIEQWKTRFWHVVDLDDPIPRRFPSDSFRPFGTYFLFGGTTGACFEDPDAIAKFLKSGCTATNFVGYGERMKQLNGKSRYRSSGPVADHFQNSLRAGLILQLAVAGILESNLQSELLQALETNEKVVYSKTKNAQLISSKRLNDVKKRMAQLEWYKKTCENRDSVYYDSYKNRVDRTAVDVISTCFHPLKRYWEQKVEEAVSKPQAPDARMRTRWLFSGVTYMRMVEPLVIADYYYRKRQDYLSQRDEHYKLLDKWNKEEQAKKKKDKAPSLTEDSCFWARVEEAQLKLGKLRDGSDREHELKEQLREFETYIMKLVDNYELSPEVFLRDSSFMVWWREYEKLLEEADTSRFVRYMKAGDYKNYK